VIPEQYFYGFVLTLLAIGGALAVFPQTRGILARLGTMEPGEAVRPCWRRRISSSRWPATSSCARFAMQPV